MTTDAIFEERGSEWLPQVSAMGTTRQLLCDQTERLVLLSCSLGSMCAVAVFQLVLLQLPLHLLSSLGWPHNLSWPDLDCVYHAKPNVFINYSASVFVNLCVDCLTSQRVFKLGLI